MPDKNLHISDQELLQFADREQTRRRSAGVRDHLAACWSCRARMAEIEGTIADFLRVRAQSVDPQLPPGAGPRALLKARFAQTAERTREIGWWHAGLPLNAAGFAGVCAVALLLFLGAKYLFRLSGQHVSHASVYAGLLPDRNLTPGATMQVTVGDVCSADRDDVIRSVPGNLKQEVFKEYGLHDAHAEDYELDYLITPGLGGAEDIRNLWPEPRYNAIWNSFVKDQLEEYLHESVCGGKLSLAAAQKDVASDWISAYKKYFHTSEPLPHDSRSNPSWVDRAFVSIAYWHSVG
jgi:hypothetical protein